GCCASGENKEKAKEKTCFLSRLSLVFIAPVDGLRGLSIGLLFQKEIRTANGRPYGVRSSC
ncbi:MAG: hypothetical protein IKM05_02080, partial [Clostridia bacterium]|nr:hypothetical protein [Clostridia bacterium]